MVTCVESLLVDGSVADKAVTALRLGPAAPVLYNSALAL